MEILDRFGVDVLDIGRVFNEKDEDWYETVTCRRLYRALSHMVPPGKTVKR